MFFLVSEDNYSTIIWERGLLGGRIYPSGKDQARALPQFPLRAMTQLSSLLYNTLSGSGGSGWQQDLRVASCRVTHSRLCPIPNNLKFTVWGRERVGKTGEREAPVQRSTQQGCNSEQVRLRPCPHEVPQILQGLPAGQNQNRSWSWSRSWNLSLAHDLQKEILDVHRV